MIRMIQESQPRPGGRVVRGSRHPSGDSAGPISEVEETARCSETREDRLIRPHRTCIITAKSVPLPAEARGLQANAGWNSSYVPELYIRFRTVDVKALRRRRLGLQTGPDDERRGWGN